MTGFTDVFGGSTLQAGQVAYAAVGLSANLATYWPPFATGTQQPCARIMDVTPTAGGFALRLPDATLAAAGQDVFLGNPSAFSYTVQDSGGNAIATIAPGTQRYLYLTDNTTSNGVWRSILMGVGASSPDASALAGSGLKVVGSTLAQSALTSTISTNTTFAATDRAKMFVNTGGAIAGTLPLTSVVSNDYFIELRNQGTGVLTVTPTGGELIDGSASITLQLNESCFVQSGVGAWYTVGRGRNTQFNFTQLLKTVTGGTTTLSLTEASNVVQTYSGTATGNNTVVLPAVVQVYYIANNVLGGFNFTLQSPTPGAVLSVPYGQAAVVFCDGVNVINASTSIGGITALLLAGGSAAAPSLAISGANNGLFAPSSTTVGVSANGTEAVRWAAGQTLVPAGTAGAPSVSFAAYPGTGWYNAGANQIALATASAQRLLIDATGQITPGADNTQNLGGVSFRFANIYAATFTGALAGNASTASTAATATTANALNAANAYQGLQFYAVPASPAPASGVGSFGVRASGSYGGGLGLIDGTFNIGLWSNSGVLNFGFGTSLGALTSKATLDASGNLTTVGSVYTPQVSINGPGTVLVANSTNSTNIKLAWQDNGVNRGYMGADSTRSFYTINAANNTYTFQVDQAGNANTPGTMGASQFNGPLVGNATTATALSTASGSAPSYGVRAWCMFNSNLAGTNAPMNGGNISSITRNSAGQYVANFAANMPNANYALSGCATAISSYNVAIEMNGGFTTSSAPFQCVANGNLVTDCGIITIFFVG